MVSRLFGKKASVYGARSIICLLFSAVIFVFASFSAAYGAPLITYDGITPLDNAIISDNAWINVGINSSEELNQSFLEWGNGSFTNITMANSSVFNWSVNMSNLLAGRYNYTVWAQNTSGDWNRSETRFVAVGAISACQDITAGNLSYVLIQNVNSSGTCFNILTNNVTIDGAGRTVNYSQSETGYAVNSTGYNNTNIKNLNIVQSDAMTAESHAIYFIASTNSNITNNTIETAGVTSMGIRLDSSSTNTISNNTITISNITGYGITLTLASNSNTLSNNAIYMPEDVSFGIFANESDSNTLSNNNVATNGAQGMGIYLLSSNSSTVSNNVITTSGETAFGILIEASGSNNITGGSIVATQGEAYYLENSGKTNTFRNTNFTAARNISFQDTSSYFKYNNETSGNIWLATNVSEPANITRALVAWSNITMQWNDTNLIAGITANYTLTGLLPRTLYYIYNTSGGFSNKSYNLTTDAAGALPSFNITLNGNTELIVDSVPNITVNTPQNASYYNTSTLAALVLNITTNEPATRCIFSLNGTQNFTMVNSATNTSWNYSGVSMPAEGLKNITYYCSDSRGNIGVSQVKYFTIDNTKPFILSITESDITSDSATIGWNTNGELTNYTVRYGPNTEKLLNISLSAFSSSSYSPPLSSLSASQHYHYEIISCDRAGNCNTTVEQDFTTAAASTDTSDDDSADTSTTITTTSGLVKAWASIAANVPETMTLGSSLVDVTQITLKFSQAVSNVKLTVAKLSSKPSSTGSDPSSKVYQYIQITPENITESKLTSAAISFQVNATWMSQNKIDSSSIILYRYSGGKWNALVTYPAEGSTAQYKKFFATTPGFSYFAIAAQTSTGATTSRVTTPASNSTNNSTIAPNNLSTTSSTLSSNSTSDNNETLSSGESSLITRNSLIVSIIIIIAAAVALVFHEKLKIKLPAKIGMAIPAKSKLNLPKFYAGQKTQSNEHKYTFNPSEVKKAELVYKPKPKEEKVKYAYKPKK